MGFELRYDLGVACGLGLIGLQGSAPMKRTTVVSKVAGMAKRLESEAKIHRANFDDVNHYPIVMRAFGLLGLLVGVIVLGNKTRMDGGATKDSTGQSLDAEKLTLDRELYQLVTQDF